MRSLADYADLFFQIIAGLFFYDGAYFLAQRQHIGTGGTAKIYHKTAVLLADGGTAVPAVRDISDLENRRIYQVIPFVNEEEEEELLRQMPHCRTKRWGDAVVDLMSRSGGKENGIRALCAAIGITTEETIAFGDADNDLEMLQLAGIGVAMGNALPQVRACADMVTDTVENDGIAHALQKLKLIG